MAKGGGGGFVTSGWSVMVVKRTQRWTNMNITSSVVGGALAQ